MVNLAFGKIDFDIQSMTHFLFCYLFFFLFLLFEPQTTHALVDEVKKCGCVFYANCVRSEKEIGCLERRNENLFLVPIVENRKKNIKC